MKKVLLTTTAFVGFTSAAVADVALSGRAEMGLFRTSDARTQFFTDIDVTFTMSGETDNGLTFGASVDLDEADGTGSVDAGPDGVFGTADDVGTSATGFSAATGDNSDDGGATIFISGAFGTVTMGDTDGALDWALTEAGNVGNPGSLADDETSHAGYVGAYLDGSADGQILRWDYTSGAFGVAVSVEDDNGSDNPAASIGYAVGLRYALDIAGGSVNFGLGHQEAAVNNGSVGVADDTSATGLSIAASLDNGLSAGIVYADWDSPLAAGPDSNLGVGLGYTTGRISVHANYGEIELNNGAKSAGVGIAAAYDLGGGAVVHAGYSRDDVDGSAFDFQRASFGLGLSF